MSHADSSLMSLAEWSFQYLRQKAQISREMMIERKVEEKYIQEHTRPARESYLGQLDVLQITVEGSDPNVNDDNDEDWHSASSSTSVLEGDDIMAFRGMWEGTVGRLVIYSRGIRFVRSLARKQMWDHHFLELAEMRKTQASRLSRLTKLSPAQLEFKLIDGRILHLEAMKDRDEAFNTIIGFSGLQWQSLQAARGEHDQATKTAGNHEPK